MMLRWEKEMEDEAGKWEGELTQARCYFQCKFTESLGMYLAIISEHFFIANGSKQSASEKENNVKWP